MLSERELQGIWYGERKPGIALKALSIAFAMVSAARRGLYAVGILRSVRVSVPMIVVGNISVGGTGKTPLVIALAQALRDRGWKPGVITRGFGGSAVDVVRVDAHSDPGMVGDETRLIFDSTGAPVAVGRDRIRAARELIDSGSVDVIISDDGLQHLRLARDVEVCVIDGQRRFGNGQLLPAGPLREAESRLHDVDFIVCNGGDAHDKEILMRLHGDSVVALNIPSNTRPLSALRGQRVHAVAGIGNPSRFFAQLRAAGIDVVEHTFPDHHAFTESDLAFGDALPILMTEKDAVKCRRFAHPDTWSVPVRAELPRDFYESVERKLRERNVRVAP
ncbi:MAG: tetraacyldisaccharide 4'-kinase [Rudaea sp.]